MNRPTGITILAVLSGIGGVFGLLASLALLGLSGAVAGATGLGGFVVVAGLFVLVYSVLSLALAYGFWSLKPWAWPLGIGVQVLGIVQGVLQYMNAPETGLISLIIGLAISAFILWYLMRPHVKAAFGRS